MITELQRRRIVEILDEALAEVEASEDIHPSIAEGLREVGEMLGASYDEDDE